MTRPFEKSILEINQQLRLFVWSPEVSLTKQSLLDVCTFLFLFLILPKSPVTCSIFPVPKDCTFGIHHSNSNWISNSGISFGNFIPKSKRVKKGPTLGLQMSRILECLVSFIKFLNKFEPSSSSMKIC